MAIRALILGAHLQSYRQPALKDPEAKVAWSGQRRQVETGQTGDSAHRRKRSIRQSGRLRLLFFTEVFPRPAETVRTAGLGAVRVSVPRVACGFTEGGKWKTTSTERA